MQQDNIIAINVDFIETRVALIENGMISELLMERTHQRSLVGNVFRGRVSRVLPGMQAAFVDIGLEKHAFLHASDMMKTEKGDRLINRILKEGQSLIVQVSKDQIGTKGCKITNEVSIPGRHLVYMPISQKGGVSRKIEDGQERKRLSKVLSRISTQKGSLIARTVASQASADALEADATYLYEIWADILQKNTEKNKPGLLYEDLSLALRVARDKFNDQVLKIIVDDENTYEQIKEFIDRLVPCRLDSIELYTGNQPIFDAFGIDSEIKRALERVVELPSGGTLVIDQGEALTAVDVNTGKFTGKGYKDQEQTILQTNLEAVDEIAYQVRFRNIGGLIVLDLIDMETNANRILVTNRLKEALKDDRAKTSVTEISRFGLLEMTRERTTESLGRALHEECPYCDGTGQVLSRLAIVSEVFREIIRRSDDFPVGTLEVVAHPEVATLLRTEVLSSFKALKKRIGKEIFIVENKESHIEKFQVYSRKIGRMEGA
jgi:ribonuclease G